MKKYIAIILLCLSCAPVIGNRSKNNGFVITNKSGSISCLNGSCCFPYKHHRDIDKAAAMVCINEKMDAKRIADGDLPFGEIDLSLRVVYDETKIIR